MNIKQSISTIRIANGVEWQSRQEHGAHSMFPAASTERLGRSGLSLAMDTANPHKLVSRLGNEVGVRGEHGVVREVVGDPGLLVKISELPFSYAAVNIALESGFAVAGGRFRTPQYHGIMHFTGGGHGDQYPRTYMATVMDRVEGVPLNRALQGSALESARSQLQEEARMASEAAAMKVGIDPSLIHWDSNANNFFVSPGTRGPEDVMRGPVTILDQNSSQRLTPHEWEAVASSGYRQDPRDAAAAQASDVAWGKFFNQ